MVGRVVHIAAAYLMEATAAAQPGQRRADVGVHGVPQEAKHREEAGFACAVGANQHSKTGDVLHLHLAEGPEVADAEALNLHGQKRVGSSSLVMPWRHRARRV